MSFAPLTLIVYAPQPLVARALNQIVRASGDIQLLGTASTRPEVLRLISLRPSVILLTVADDSDLRPIPTIHRESPGSRIILWTNKMTEGAEQAVRAMGIHGILRPGNSSEQILECIRRIDQGEYWFEPPHAPRPVSSRKLNLTPREAKLITLVSQGLTNHEIALLLDTSPAAVKAYLSRLQTKTGLHDRVELVLFGVRHLNSSLSIELSAVT
jgi:DNA-binding NarL/FixJ family response regulator